jgi:hypothetical protein
VVGRAAAQAVLTLRGHERIHGEAHCVAESGIVTGGAEQLGHGAMELRQQLPGGRSRPVRRGRRRTVPGTAGPVVMARRVGHVGGVPGVGALVRPLGQHDERHGRQPGLAQGGAIGVTLGGVPAVLVAEARREQCKPVRPAVERLDEPTVGDVAAQLAAGAAVQCVGTGAARRGEQQQASDMVEQLGFHGCLQAKVVLQYRRPGGANPWLVGPVAEEAES